MKKIDPKNLTAQLHYRAAGNPPSTLPDSAISNCYPGLEFDFRNIWRRLFEGILLHEADNYVVEGKGNLKRLKGHRLVRVAGKNTMKQAIGPQLPGAADQLLTTELNPAGAWAMEWSNSMASILHEFAGRKVPCTFTKKPADLPVWVPEDPAAPTTVELETLELTVNPLFAWSETAQGHLAVIDEAMVEVGELTQSLCSPWQNDYRECACYYWAASRPDYVNVEPNDQGLSQGNMWFAIDREPKEYIPDNTQDSRLFSYEDLFRDWQGKLKFIVQGKDSD
jgi:hypothetical protein